MPPAVKRMAGNNQDEPNDKEGDNGDPHVV